MSIILLSQVHWRGWGGGSMSLGGGGVRFMLVSVQSRQNFVHSMSITALGFFIRRANKTGYQAELSLFELLLV